MQKLTFATEGVNPVWPDETITQLVALLNKKHQPFLRDESFRVEAGADKAQVQLRITLARNDGSVAYPIEVIHVREPGVKEPSDALASLMLDYLDVYWFEYLGGDRDVFVPIDWSLHTCEGVDFYLRGFVRNLSLEEQADALFREHGTGGHDIEPITGET